ncbi:MAG: hypothetical protein K1X74_22070 [Pirellulales bacterium]|nr:hypothetical protein [Pirellulales bacterium]
MRSSPGSRRVLRAAVLIVLGIVAATVSGCTPEAARPGSGGFSPEAQARQRAAELFTVALDNLQRLAGFPPDKMLEQVVARLNDWQMQAKPAIETPASALLETLPEELRGGPGARSRLESRYTLDDAIFLAEAIWLTDIANRTARIGSTIDGSPAATPLGRAARQFDWVVRNIAIDSATGAEPRPVWQTLLAGRGTLDERIAVLVRLGRQQGIDWVLVTRAGHEPLVAVVLDAKPAGQGPQLYLFDPLQGIALPGSGGAGIATLSQAQDDPAIVSQFHGEGGGNYAWQSGDFAELTLLIEAGPQYLAGRLRAIESNLAGDRRLVLGFDPDTLAQRLAVVRGATRVAAWEHPYRVAQPTELPAEGPGPLAAAVLPGAGVALGEGFKRVPQRLLQGRIDHLRGQFAGEPSATDAYLKCRPADADLAAASMSDEAKGVLREAKRRASVWLGLLSFERGNFATAVDFLDGDDSPFARYNLARTQEASGKFAEAIALYEADDSPARVGSLWRARRLREQHPTSGGDQPPAASATQP